MTNNIGILGSTGSIGTQTLEVIREIGSVKVWAMSTNTNIALFELQVREFMPDIVCVMDNTKAKEFRENIKDLNVKVCTGMEGLIEIATYHKVDTIVNSVVGNIGLLPTIRAIENKKDIALANKETLVTAGELIMNLIKEHNTNIYPVDSEHSAIFQALQGNQNNKINKIYLTASGGPFREVDDVSNVTVDDALNHPNWSMGKKITIDSATLMNKGLEVIEAKWLFGVELEQIDVLVHPQSIVHSMVEYEDGAVVAQLGEPDMKVPIQYALTYPNRIKNSFPKINFFERNHLTFDKPNLNKFECLQLAYDAIKIGGTMPTVLNAANEIAVDKFINKQIKFLDIPIIIKATMNAYNVKYNYSLQDIIDADSWAREYTNNLGVK